MAYGGDRFESKEGVRGVVVVSCPNCSFETTCKPKATVPMYCPEGCGYRTSMTREFKERE